jgi:hypothetical protein
VIRLLRCTGLPCLLGVHEDRPWLRSYVRCVRCQRVERRR